MPKNKQILIIYIFLTVATFIAFWQVRNCDFVNYDDPIYVTKNNHIQNGITMEGIRWAFTTSYATNWHPLTWISHMLDVQFYGLDPGWHHITNLLFHIANALLLFFVLNRMTKDHWKSAFVAALFALHPLHVESVSWVAERKDVLSAFFWILTMGAYQFYVELPGIRRYIAVLLFFILGLLSKPMLVTLPFVLLLLDYWPLQRFVEKHEAQKKAQANSTISNNKRSRNLKKERAVEVKAVETPHYKWALIRPLLWEKIPLFFFAALSSFVTYIAQQKGGAVESMVAYPLSARIANAFVSFVTYIGKMVWPFNLAVFYPYQSSWPIWQILGTVLFFVTVTLMVIWTARRFPYLSVGWLWYIGTLVPVIGLVQVGMQARADRYTYIPLIGMFIIVAWSVPELLKQLRYRKEVLSASSALVLSCLFIITWTQVGYWQNSITLFDHAVKITDNNYIAHFSLGESYADRGNLRKAIEDYDKSIDVNPKYPEAYYNRGNAYAALGNPMQAIADYTKVIELMPYDVETYANRGNAYYDMGNYQQAIRDYSKIIDLNPKLAYPYYNRGNAYLALGDEKQAIDNYDKAIELNPEYAEAYSNRGIAYGRLGNQKQALEDVKTAARLGNQVARNILRNRGVSW